MFSLAVNQRDPEEVRVALHEGPKLLDLRWAHADRPTRVGNIYLAVVRQVEPGLDAAFVDFGDRRAGFLHRGNVHPAYADKSLSPVQVAGMPSRQADALADDPEHESAAGEPTADRIEDLLEVGQEMLVQVLRDPVRGKGATLTTILSLPGRQTVLVPSLGRVGVSRRLVDSDLRKRLRALVEGELAGTGLGAIARTASGAAEEEEIVADLTPLRQAWQQVEDGAEAAAAPSLLYEEAGPTTRAVRELITADLTRVVVDGEEAAQSIERLLERYAPGREIKVERYRERRPLFEMLGIERDWQMLFRSRVPVGSGASIVIHETEALTAIDVNSGRVDRGSLEATALEANCLAAEEAARQIRLRDLGGIIVADFIDMQDPDNRRELERVLRAALRADRARLKLGRMSSFGLFSMTRRRQGAGLPRAAEAICPHCAGSGHVGHHQAGALRLLRRLRALEPGQAYRVRLHPEVEDTLFASHQPALDELGLELEFEPDAQVPSGEPVVEALAGSRSDR